MATTTVAHTYKLKRGKQDAVEAANPLLLAGEPIVVYCNDGYTRMKVGDGETYYSELPFIGEESICSRPTRYQFPNVGFNNVVYKAEDEAMLYQWNPNLDVYEVLGPASGGGTLDVDVISGGTAESLL